MKTDQEIVDQCNQLARVFYKSMGCQVPDGFKFWESVHPQEIGCWHMAVAAYEHIEGTDVEDALSSVIDN